MPPPTTTSRPGRLLGSLAVLIVILLLGVLAGSIAQPSNWHKRFKVDLGLDLSSGTTVTLKAVPPKGTSATQLASDMTTAQQIMSNRVNGAGFNGASVTTQGTNLINVTVPGQGSKQVIDLVGTTALLRFRQVLLEAQNYTATTSAKVTPAGAGSGAHGLAASAKSLTSGPAAAKAEPKANASPSPSASATPSPSASASPSPSASSGGKTSEKLSTTADGQGDASALSAKTKALFDKVNCADSNWKTKIYGKNPNNYDNTGTQVVTCYQGLKYALGKAIVTGSQLKLGGSSAVLQSNGSWYVDMNFNGEGTKAFATFTSDLFSKYAGSSTEPLNYFAVVLDGAPASVAYISSAITTGSGQIEGNFTEAQADQLVNVLNYGALPLAFSEQSQQTVSAELGSTQLQAGLLAGAVGLFLVVVYAFLYYRGLGAVAISSLAISALLTFLSVVLLSLYEKFALSLAGVAGLIVAIGITADSFVVFFERLRDEVREGKSLRTAVERGWQRARRTILVSDSVSFIAAAVLYKFAVTDVQNFAFTLGLTTLVDVIVVFLFTKPMITLLARTKFYGGGHRLSGLDPARLGARSPWRGTRRPVRRPQTREAPGANATAAQPRTNPKEA
ncbi:MAG: protein translocase subunit SecD [Streptosporangiaceae bacterium]